MVIVEALSVNSAFEECPVGLQNVTLNIIIALLESLDKKASILLVNSSQLVRSRADKGVNELDCSATDFPGSVIIILVSHLLIFKV